jgi:hypothetical protein
MFQTAVVSAIAVIALCIIGVKFNINNEKYDAIIFILILLTLVLCVLSLIAKLWPIMP